MTTFLALLLSRATPLLRRFAQAIVVGATRHGRAAKRRGDEMAEVLYRGGIHALVAARTTATGLFSAAQASAASAVDRQCPDPAVAPALAAAIGASAPTPRTVAGLGRAVAVRTRRTVDEVALRFADRWTEPDEARMAAGLFVGSLALVCAGVVGLAAVAAPTPGLHLQRLAAVINLTDAPLVSATREKTATTSPGATAPTAAAPVGDAAPESAPAAMTTAEAPAAAEAPASTIAPAAPPVSSATRAVAAEATPPAKRGGLPVGKGMWIWMEDRAEGGDPNAIVARAKATGLTHLYVRTGTLKGGFIGGPFLDRLLPVAHANGIRVYGWDFPYLDRPGDDVNRALAAIHHTTPDGHRIDGFSSDIESSREGTNNNVENVSAYCSWLRQNVGPDYPLIATLPNPTAHKIKTGFPYDAIVPHFDAVAPMVYWMNRDPATDVANAIAFFGKWGKPVFPVGQAYDGGPEGGPPGPPSRDAMIRFLQFADGAGGAGVSFWSWQHATPEAWDAVRDAAEFRLEPGGEGGAGLSPGMIRAYQTVLNGLGFPVTADGAWGRSTTDAVRAYQAEAKLPVTGRIDAATRAFLLAPVPAPIAVH